jgi:hypothetical protein
MRDKMKIDLGNIKLVEFNKEDKNHLNYLKNLLNDEKVTSRFKGILPALMKKEEGILVKCNQCQGLNKKKRV